MKRAYLAALLGGFLVFGAAPAFAQDIDRVTGYAPGAGGRAPEGVKVVSPGALLFASFDRNYDGRITPEEVAAGAEGAFLTADRNKDGVITGFEQTDWAASMGANSDILANAMTFDINLDRSVTKEEFASGLKRLAGQLASQPNGDILFADLLKPLTRPDDEASNGGFGLGTISPRIGGSRPPGG